jgi:hypothetical protein
MKERTMLSLRKIGSMLSRRMVFSYLMIEIEHLYVNPNEETQQYSLYEPDNDDEFELQVYIQILT